MYLSSTLSLKKIINVIILLTEKHLLVKMWHFMRVRPISLGQILGKSDICGMKKDFSMSLSSLWTFKEDMTLSLSHLLMSKLDSKDEIEGEKEKDNSIEEEKEVGTSSKEWEERYSISKDGEKKILNYSRRKPINKAILHSLPC